jgi:DNA polymerase III sliding clamp (beta) subunit (PCNA family)
MDGRNDRDQLRSSPHPGLNQNYLGRHTDSDIDHSRSSMDPSLSTNSSSQDSHLRPYYNGHQSGKSFQDVIRKLKEENLILKTENKTIKLVWTFHRLIDTDKIP